MYLVFGFLNHNHLEPKSTLASSFVYSSDAMPYNLKLLFSVFLLSFILMEPLKCLFKMALLCLLKKTYSCAIWEDKNDRPVPFLWLSAISTSNSKEKLEFSYWWAELDKQLRTIRDRCLSIYRSYVLLLNICVIIFGLNGHFLAPTTENSQCLRV